MGAVLMMSLLLVAAVSYTQRSDPVIGEETGEIKEP